MQLKRIVFTGIASKLSAECPGKTAGVAEACHICNLDHRILAALNQRQTLVYTIFFQIAGNCFAGHFFEQAAADLFGPVSYTHLDVYKRQDNYCPDMYIDMYVSWHFDVSYQFVCR